MDNFLQTIKFLDKKKEIDNSYIKYNEEIINEDIIFLINKKIINSDNLYCNIGPVCDIYPIKNNRQKLVLIFYIENDIMKWVLYEYKQLEIPKNINTYFNAGICESSSFKYKN